MKCNVMSCYVRFCYVCMYTLHGHLHQLQASCAKPMATSMMTPEGWKPFSLDWEETWQLEILGRTCFFAWSKSCVFFPESY